MDENAVKVILEKAILIKYFIHLMKDVFMSCGKKQIVLKIYWTN